MSQVNPTTVRRPVVAGRFYPGQPQQCAQLAQSYLQPDASAAGDKPWLGGLVPHAGWICSGAIAGQTISTLAARSKPDVIVLFGAIHTPYRVQSGALDTHGRWAVPTGESQLQVDVEQQLGQQGKLFIAEPRLHDNEHAIEVVLPMVQLAWPGVAIIPIEVPPLPVAELIGRLTAQVLSTANLNAVYLASSDLTHYGQNYGYLPAGLGPSAMQWAKDNDKPLLDHIANLNPSAVVAEVQKHHNACGAGAIAAMLAACKEAGASTGRILTHATSYETLATVAPQPPHNAVGYASAVVG